MASRNPPIGKIPRPLTASEWRAVKERADNPFFKTGPLVDRMPTGIKEENKLFLANPKPGKYSPYGALGISTKTKTNPGHLGLLLKRPEGNEFFDPQGKSYEDEDSAFFEYGRQVDELARPYKQSGKRFELQKSRPVCKLISALRHGHSEKSNEEFANMYQEGIKRTGLEDAFPDERNLGLEDDLFAVETAKYSAPPLREEAVAEWRTGLGKCPKCHKCRKCGLFK